MKKRLYWKFLREGMRSDSGDTTWKIGEWQHQDGEIKLCKNGFHCSKSIYQAFSYVHGEILAQVEVKGESDKEKDKEAWSDMRIVKAWKWEKKDSVALAVFAAELVLDIYEKAYPNDDRPRKAIEAARTWLKHPTKKNLAAAWAAEAAGAAAWAAWAAEAAGAAAWAAWAEINGRISEYMDRQVEHLELIGEMTRRGEVIGK